MYQALQSLGIDTAADHLSQRDPRHPAPQLPARPHGALPGLVRQVSEEIRGQPDWSGRTGAMMQRTTRRSLLRAAPAALAPFAAGSAQTGAPAERPNIVLIISDQFRWDCVGAMGLNPMNLTPESRRDGRTRRDVPQGVLCPTGVRAGARQHFHRPVPQPARRVEEWLRAGSRTPPHWPVRCDRPAIRPTISASGTSRVITAYPQAGDARPCEPRSSRRIPDLWQAANALELTSHAYEGDLFDSDGKPIHFSGLYRTDFMTGRAQRFLRSAKSPFLLTLSYLEVHHQNDMDTFVPPKEFAGRYPNPFRSARPASAARLVAQPACRLLRVRRQDG